MSSGPLLRLAICFLLVATIPLPAYRPASASAADSGAGGTIQLNQSMRYFVTAIPDSAGGGNEPNVFAGPGVDGHEWYFRDSPRGGPNGQSGDFWVSKDDGATWIFVPKQAKGTNGASGDSFSLVTKDGTIYYTNLFLASASIDTSTNGGKTWVHNPIASVTPIDDRQWLASGPTIRGTFFSKPETVYMIYNQIPSGLWIMRSQHTAAGLAWAPGNLNRPVTTDIRARDMLAVDKHDGTVYLPNTESGGLFIYVSSDGANSFKRYPIMPGPAGEEFQNIFVVPRVDDGGNVYVVWSNQSQIKMGVSSDKGASWHFLNVTSGNGTRVFPWVAAGDVGRVGVTYYETNVTGLSDELENASWVVKAAITTDALANNVTFHISNATDVIHVGSIRTTGTAGSADRDLGDYFTCDADRYGRLIMTFGFDGDDGVGTYKSLAMFARQVSGPFLRAGTGPVARLETIIHGLQVMADGQSSVDLNGHGIENYTWTWGDGMNDTGPLANHTYARPGTYNVTLEVTDKDNMSMIGSETVVIREEAAQQFPMQYLVIAGIVAAVAGVYLVLRQRRKDHTKLPSEVRIAPAASTAGPVAPENPRR